MVDLVDLFFETSVMIRSTVFLTISVFASTILTAQNAPDLSRLVQEKKITVVNRNISILNDPQKGKAIHLDEKEGDGVAWVNDISFGNGTIEFDVKGRNVMQQSFVGVAFHGLDDSTMDAVYFRPFNFQSPDADRKSHSVQYVSLPVYDWQKLRTQFPNKYEHAIDPSPQPTDWFHVRVEVKSPKITVFVNNNSIPALTVDQLNDRKQGKIGFWVGNNSDGYFANLRITRE